jgi:uncharacterized protein (TIGR03435 family)
MNRQTRRLCAIVGFLACVWCVHATAQTIEDVDPAKLPRFEVASVKPNGSGSEQWQFDTPRGRVTATNITLLGLIRYAYSIFGSDSDGRITAPEWTKTERFDIDARTHGIVARDAAMSMLRSLLGARFAMKAHSEKQQRPVYALILARTDRRLGPQLKPDPIDCEAYLAAAQDAQRRGTPPARNHAGTAPTCGQNGAPGHLIANGLTMQQLATTLSGLGRPVIDETGLNTQRFDYELRWTPVTASSGASTSDAGSIFTALEEQLGLKLVPKEAPLDVLVIDHIERPAPN